MGFWSKLVDWFIIAIINALEFQILECSDRCSGELRLKAYVSVSRPLHGKVTPWLKCTLYDAWWIILGLIIKRLIKIYENIYSRIEIYIHFIEVILFIRVCC